MAMWRLLSLAPLAASLPLSIPLERKAHESLGASKTYYVGTVSVGVETPQELKVAHFNAIFIHFNSMFESQVAFETASGSLVLDSTHCQSPACLKHRRYVASGQQLNQLGGVVGVSERASLSVDYNEDCGPRRYIVAVSRFRRAGQ